MQADGAEVASYTNSFSKSLLPGWLDHRGDTAKSSSGPIAAYKQSFVLATALALLVIALSALRRSPHAGAA
jgi:hypothetical protein